LITLDKAPKKGILSEECQAGAYPDSRVLYKPKTYKINLDLKPNERWNQIGKDYSKEVKNILKTVIHVVNKINDKIVPFILKVTSDLK